MSDDNLAELDLDCVTITRDADGLVIVDGGGMSREAVSHLLLVGQTVHALAEFETDDEEDDEE